MYMRLVRFRMLPGKSKEILDLYHDQVLPELSKTPGCLFAALTGSVKRPDEYVSLTLWSSRAEIAEYEQRGAFDKLLRATERFQSESGEWRVQLGDDLTLDYGPVKEPPKILAYRCQTEVSENDLEQARSAEYLRILRLFVAPDRLDEFRERYQKEAIPALRAVQGCLYACLLENLESETQLASMTVWSSRQAAEKYEKSEVFQQLVQRAREVVGAKTWDLMLEMHRADDSEASPPIPSQDYEVVASKNLRR